MVASETWLFRQGIVINNIGILIRLSIPLILVVFFRKYATPSKAMFLFFLYGVLAVYLISFSFFSESPGAVALYTIKYLCILTFPLALLLVLRPGRFSYSFLYVPVYLGLFFSIQTIILFILIQTGNPPPEQILTLVGYPDMPVLSYGIWGYAHGMNAIGSSLQVYRAQSFFGEPTNLACFLEVSAILSFGLYRIRKSKMMLIAFILCSIALVITFAMTAYVAIFLVLCFSLIVKYWKRMKLLAPAALILTVIFAVASILLYLHIATDNDIYGHSKLSMAFGHAPTEITRRQDFVVNSLRLLRDFPFGIGLQGARENVAIVNYPGAGGRMVLFEWTKIAGFIGLLIQLSIVFYVMKNIVLKYINDSNKIERYLGLSFIALLLHHGLAGDWFTAMFFFLVAALIVTDAYQFSFRDEPRSGKAMSATTFIGD